MPIKTYNETRVCIASSDGDEQRTRAVPERLAEKELERARKEGQPEPSILASQTFVIKYATDDKDVLELVPDEKTRVEYFNRAYILATQKEANELLTSDDFVATDGARDLQAEVAIIKERTRKTRAVKDMSLEELLEAIPSDMVAKLVQRFVRDSA